MPHYYFDVRNGRRHKDSLGLDCPDDNGAIAKAKFIATRSLSILPSSITAMSLF
jgi:hypothetical protein